MPLSTTPSRLSSATASVFKWEITESGFFGSLNNPGTSLMNTSRLAFSAMAGVRSMNEVFPLERAAEAYERMMSGKARFRVVLTTGY